MHGWKPAGFLLVIAVVFGAVNSLHAAPYSEVDQGSSANQVTATIVSDSISHAPCRVGLEGYCPVEVVEEYRWQRGEQDISVTYDGQTFHFASTAARKKFLANPTHYAPTNRGLDVVMLRDFQLYRPGLRKHGLRHAGLTYLFSSEETLEQFVKDPDKYVKPLKLAE
jgi:YHS domain-containing protein